MSKFHINKHGVPAPCKATKGNCPLGGADGSENHFDTVEEAQAFVDNKNAQEHGLIPGMQREGFHEGSKFSAEESQISSLSKPLTPESLSSTLSSATEGKDVAFSYETESFNNTPVEFSGEVTKIGDDTYSMKVRMGQYSMTEDDFEDEGEFEDYLSSGPDEDYEYEYKFNSSELKNVMESQGAFKRSASAEKAPGAIYSGLYEMSQDHIE